MECVLLTKLQHCCISQFGNITGLYPRIKLRATPKCCSISQFGKITELYLHIDLWTTPKCCDMCSALPHSAAWEGVPPPGLCIFRKSELWRGMATDWWMWVQETQWGIYTVYNNIIVQTSFIGSCVTWRIVVPYYIQLASVHGSLIHTVPTPTDTHSYTLYFL